MTNITSDIHVTFKDRMARHNRGEVTYTSTRLPVEVKVVIGGTGPIHRY